MFPLGLCELLTKQKMKRGEGERREVQMIFIYSTKWLHRSQNKFRIALPPLFIFPLASFFAWSKHWKSLLLNISLLCPMETLAMQAVEHNHNDYLKVEGTHGFYGEHPKVTIGKKTTSIISFHCQCLVNPLSLEFFLWKLQPHAISFKYLCHCSTKALMQTIFSL